VLGRAGECGLGQEREGIGPDSRWFHDGRPDVISFHSTPVGLPLQFQKSSLDETMRNLFANSCPVTPLMQKPAEDLTFLPSMQHGRYDKFTPRSPTHFAATGQQLTAIVKAAIPVSVVHDCCHADADDERQATNPRGEKKREWSDGQKHKHSQACKSKSRLTLSEKLEIIRLSESSDASERKSQKELAAMFGKSRMTISTILKPVNVEWFKKLAASGVRREAKRYMRSAHPDFQHLVFEAVGRGMKPVTRQEVAQAAEATARRHGIRDFEAAAKWCSRFIQQHGIPIKSAARSKPDRPVPIVQGDIEAGFPTTHPHGKHLEQVPATRPAVAPTFPIPVMHDELTQVLPSRALPKRARATASSCRPTAHE